MTVQHAFASRLLHWFDGSGRKDLPWQEDTSPYRVWVSEIMLQQTQVNTVIPYFHRFMARFPDVETLAGAPVDAVLHLWTGLGYYARARNLYSAAQQIVTIGHFPHTVDALCELPGIGRSTAGAIVAIAFGKRAVILDGNVKRVLARCFDIEGWPEQSAIRARFWQTAEALTPYDRCADYTQAIMDLGATVCTRTRPDCTSCPMAGQCLALARGRTSTLPTPKPRKSLPVRSTTMLILRNQSGQVLLERRPATGIWGGLYSFPEAEPSELAERMGFEPDSALALGKMRHTFTHYHLDITPVLIEMDPAGEIRSDDNMVWYSPDDASLQVGVSRPVTRLLAQLDRPDLFGFE